MFIWLKIMWLPAKLGKTSLIPIKCRRALLYSTFMKKQNRISFSNRSVPDDNNNLLGFIPSKLFWRTTSFCFHQPWMQYVNWLYFHYQRTHHNQISAGNITNFSDFYFIHNNIPNFYSVYEPNGFIEIQLLLPKAAAIELQEIVERQENGLHPHYLEWKGFARWLSYFLSRRRCIFVLDIPVTPFDLKNWENAHIQSTKRFVNLMGR